jgi:hypothetical protein
VSGVALDAIVWNRARRSNEGEVRLCRHGATRVRRRKYNLRRDPRLDEGSTARAFLRAEDFTAIGSRGGAGREVIMRLPPVFSASPRPL